MRSLQRSVGVVGSLVVVHRRELQVVFVCDAIDGRPSDADVLLGCDGDLQASV